jgi:hypothetical protein
MRINKLFSESLLKASFLRTFKVSTNETVPGVYVVLLKTPNWEDSSFGFVWLDL